MEASRGRIRLNRATSEPVSIVASILKVNGYDIVPEADTELMAVAFLELIDRHRTTEAFETYLADYVVPSNLVP
ncbi:hypothetical protein EV130_103404 [Rhizobium azibense]|uniref:Uncharacterized protein n=1 Tax=Rhizobium azibense TaxID=1136135 RepID=A0A4R3RZ97_9HYPH|nr:hypothetical protein EV130_103404 [Rhizobium azibense]TCU37216.1 hypothetical protein EV129_106178 [Rhizobium azibense]